MEGQIAEQLMQKQGLGLLWSSSETIFQTPNLNQVQFGPSSQTPNLIGVQSSLGPVWVQTHVASWWHSIQTQRGAHR